MLPNTPQPAKSLERFRLVKQAEIFALRRAEALGNMPAVFAGPRPSFYAALQAQGGLPAVIAEYKRASPSRGWIQQHLQPEDVGPAYQQAGAVALSVLTEEEYFKGYLQHMQRMHAAGVTVPMLRKDFIFDPIQVLHSASTPAAALLLIVRLTPDSAVLRNLREHAEFLGMDVVVEVFNVAELVMARESGARIIQVNARDLDSFRINMGATLKLASQYRHKDSAGYSNSGNNERWIAASGVKNHQHLIDAINVGFDAVLVGTRLMEQGQPAQSLTALLHDGEAFRAC